MSSLPENEFSESIFEKEHIIVCYIARNNFFVSFEISGGSYNPSQNTLRVINKFEKCIPSFMESLIADFLALAPSFYFCKRDWPLDFVCTQFRDLSKISPFFKSVGNF